MSPTLTIVALWVAFALSHMALSSLKLRPRLVSVLTPNGFLGAYSVLSFAFFVPLVSTYFRHKHTGAMLWSIRVTPALEVAIVVVMGIALTMLIAGVLTPSPASISGRGPEAAEAKGVQLVTRHAVFMAVAIFGAVHLIPNGFASDVAFFAGFPVFAVLGSWHQDQRKLVTEAERYGPFYASTPWLPFTGARTVEGLSRIKPLTYALGIGATALVRYFHASWFGG